MPGCSFQRGETTYKIAVLPLGGYVKMVGEGADGDEDEDDPRSFKNKTVGQRMLIISAGVIMNMLLGACCFIIVYRATAWNAQPAAIDLGSIPVRRPGRRAFTPARSSRRSGTSQIRFRRLQIKVALTWQGEVVPFTFKRDGKTSEVNLEPRRDENSRLPRIGVGPPSSVQLSKRPGCLSTVRRR